MHTLLGLTGLIVWCLIVAAVVLAAGGNLRCGVDRGEPGIVVVACQSPVFDH